MTSKKKKITKELDFNCDEQSFSNSVCIHKIIRDFKTGNDDTAKAKLNLVFKRILAELDSVRTADHESLSALEYMISDFIDNIYNKSDTEKRLLEEFDRFVEELHDDDESYLNDIY